MKLKLNSCILVKPQEHTWNGFIPLTELDRMQARRYDYVRTIRLYRYPRDNWIPSHAVSEVLKTSLEKVLVKFYPLAGRLSRVNGGQLWIECNNEGILFMEVEADVMLDELKELEHSQLVPFLDLTTPLPQLPLAAVQVTRFGCSGVCLGLAMSHAIMDRQSSALFLQEWARVARGLPMRDEPFLDRDLLVAAGREPCSSAVALSRPAEFNPMPLLIGQSSSRDEKKKPTTKTFLKLTKSQVEMLVCEANNHGRAGELSRFQAITAHIWRCSCKARGHRPEQPTRLTTVIDIRQRMQPLLPKPYFGNAVLFIAAFDHAGDLITKHLSYAATRIRETINKATHEYVSATISFMRSLDNVPLIQDSTSLSNPDEELYGNPNIWVTNWLSLQSSNFDFGWGKEFYMTSTGGRRDGDFIIMQGHDEEKGSVMVRACLQEVHMEAFKKFFYEDIMGFLRL